MKIIFLDVDGVMHTPLDVEVQGQAALGEAQIALLRAVVKKTGAVVVLTSTWRYVPWKVEKLEKELGFKMHGQTGLDQNCRAEEIRTYLKSVNPDAFVVLDDSAIGPGFEDVFIKVDKDFGLTEADADKVVEMLNSM